MRSLVAGIVGGISGGGAVLMAVMLLRIQGRDIVDHASAIAIQPSQLPSHLAVPDSPTAGIPESSRQPSESAAITIVQGVEALPKAPQSAIDTAPIMITSAVVPDVGAIPTEWVMPAGLVEELHPEPVGRSGVANQSASPPPLVTEPITVTDNIEREASDGNGHYAPTIVPAEPEATAKSISPPDIMRPADAAQQGHNAKASTSVAEPALPDPPAYRAAPIPAQQEPAELRALRSFRLTVPKELPKVDLAPNAALMWTDSAPIEPTAAAPLSATTTAAVMEAQSARESLMRASDAVKRLSRRMGGRYGR